MNRASRFSKYLAPCPRIQPPPCTTPYEVRLDGETVELVHEALLERWQRLVDWLEADVQGRLQHRHLTLAAKEWQAAGRDPSTLYRGARLAGALDWATEHAPDLNQLERHFLDESQAASLREASRQRRTNRRLRALR